MASAATDACHPGLAKRNEAVAVELMKGGHPRSGSMLWIAEGHASVDSRPGAHAHMTKNETHVHQRSNFYQHNQTVNVVNAGASVDELAVYALARRDVIVSQLQAGHTAEKT